jgi:two-component system, response regulator PdtaR
MPQTSIFIVEDELIEAEDMRQTLEKQGYSVTGIARSGESALAALRKNQPDLVLMDIHIAGTMDGIDTAERIHFLYQIPVIFLTAHADETTLGRAKITEPYGYILKPFDERELHSAIEMALYKHRMEEVTQENERTIRVLANAIPDAVMLLDHNQQIIAHNNAMALRLGRDPPGPGEVPARLSDYPKICSLVGSRITETLHYGRSTRFEEKSGTEWFDVSLHPLPGTAPGRSLILVQYHDISDYKRLGEQLKTEGITQIEQNMEQFQILNDQIRNPLQAIMGYVNLDCIQYRERIMEQIGLIDNLVSCLDHGWVESEKVRNFLLRHYSNNPDTHPGLQKDKTHGGHS